MGEFRNNVRVAKGELQYADRSSYNKISRMVSAMASKVYYGITEDIKRGEWKDNLRRGMGVYSCKPAYVYR